MKNSSPDRNLKPRKWRENFRVEINVDVAKVITAVALIYIILQGIACTLSN